MNKEIEKRKAKNVEIRKLYDKATEVCSEFFSNEYRYSDEEAIEELGLDKELIHQLVEDYVVQILTSITQFEDFIEQLNSETTSNESPNYTPLQELAHKNLGVARNLRIKDAEQLLSTMMKKEDLKYLNLCLKILKSCAIKLNPERAYNTLKLIEVKSGF